MGGGSWNDEIICTLRKNGSLSLRPRKPGDDGTVSIAGVTANPVAEKFVQALISMADSVTTTTLIPRL